MQTADREFHRKTAVECFNRARDYLEKKDRTIHDDHLMLHLAHTSRYHWSFVGTAKNLAIGDWQVSRVYAALRQPDLSLHFAKASLEIGEKNSLLEVVLSANEAMARAYATGKKAAGETDASRPHLKRISVERKEGPLLVPQKVFDWKMVYDPAGEVGGGSLTATLGTESVTLPLKPGDKTIGGIFDRFGLFTSHIGGSYVKIYFDDLEYTTGNTRGLVVP